MRHDRLALLPPRAVTEVEQRPLSSYDAAFGLEADEGVS